MGNRALSLCLAVVRWAPVVFITAVIVWSYYAYVVEMCLFTVESIPEKILYLVCYHPLLILFVWVYGKTIFTPPAGVPKKFFLSRQDVERFQREENEDVQREILATAGRNLPVQCRTGSGALRYCERCKCIKPDRAHHCSVCGKCILKMDHHCPWVNNCVCFSNYKFFVLFLGYALLYCLYVAATSLQYFIKFWTGMSAGLGNLHILFLFFAGVMFAVSLTFLFGYHLVLTCKNRSTLESFRAPIFRSGPDKDGFSLGRHGNYLEIFGDDRKLWFLPIFTSQGDGVSFPTRVVANSYHSMENTASATPGPLTIPPPPPPPATQPSFGDGVTYPIRTVDEDYDSLLGERQRWMEEGADDGGYYNQMAAERM